MRTELVRSSVKRSACVCTSSARIHVITLLRRKIHYRNNCNSLTSIDSAKDSFSKILFITSFSKDKS